MKIAEISAFANYSVGKIMRDIKDYVNSNTNDVCEIFYARGLKINEFGMNKFSSNFEIYLNAAVARIFDNDGFGFKSNTKRLIKKIEKFQPDVIHIHCLHGYYMNIKLLFKYLKKCNAKIVWTMHDTWAVTGHCCFFSKINCKKWETGCNKCLLKKEYPTSYIIDASKKNYKNKKKIFSSLDYDKLMVVTPSIWMKNILNLSYLNRYKINVIYNGIDLSKFNSELKQDERNKKILLGIASVWDDRKGLDVFLELSKFIDDNWEIILIGKIENSIKLPNNITHIDRTTNQQELINFYRKCNVFLNPTRDDNYPTVNLEAQACGAKVLTFDTGGCLETQAGNLYSCDCKQIDYIISKIYEVDGLPLNAINYDKLSKKRMAIEYYNLFKECIKR